MLFCLARFIPGKAGIVIRKLLTLFIFFVVVYAVAWAMILKSLKFNPKAGTVTNQTLNQEIEVENNSYGSIELIDLDFYGMNDAKIPKTSEGLPLNIESKQSKNFKIWLNYEQFQSIEMRVKIMGLTKTFKQKIPENK
jgi:hypothetical protein